MEEMTSLPCKAYPNVSFRTALKSNGVECYQHKLLCADDVLDVIDESESFDREEIVKRFTLEENSIGSPEQHVGEKSRKSHLKWCQILEL